jgi:hypothetical protein
MDKASIVKIVIAALVAGGGAYGAQEAAGGDINFAPIVSAILSTIAALLYPSPTKQ